MGPADAHDEAERWFVRLQEGVYPASELAAFERWRAADPAHAAAYREVERLWALGGEAVKDPAVMAAAMRALHPSEPAPDRVRRWLPAVALAAAATLAAVVAVPRWLAPPELPPGIQHVTRVGERRELRLPDGSMATLDTATVLVERYLARERRVELRQGRAQFQVQGNPERPFVVHAQGGTITAIGTVFQVRVGETTRITLLEGELAIATENGVGASRGVVRLTSGQELTFDHEGRVGAATAIDAKAARGWTEGKLFVDNWRLDALLAEMNRYSDTRLRLDDPALRGLRISGVFRTGDQDMLVRMLQQGWSLRAERRDGQIVLSRR
jgi:transmembrane sensor